jgi:hypothetical protein
LGIALGAFGLVGNRYMTNQRQPRLRVLGANLVVLLCPERALWTFFEGAAAEDAYTPYRRRTPSDEITLFSTKDF